MKYLCLIPARKNSTRLKDKNILQISNRPLVYWSMKIALKVKYFKKIIVSSDSNEVEKITNKFDKIEFIKRPKSISNNRAKMESVLKHAIKYYKNKKVFFDAVVILQPTSPLRRLKTINKCCKIFSTGKYDTLATVTKLGFKSYPSRIIKFKNKNKLIKNFDFTYSSTKSLYRLDGGVVFIKKIKSFKNKILSGKTKFFEINYPESIDIDDSLNFKTAELFFKENDLYK
tara:strand:+ start:4360 stop:5046 length:687 start_codon:yes stop_codon:yes gene_type:complete